MQEDKKNTSSGELSLSGHSDAPVNLGKLGEEYVFWWLLQQPWIHGVKWPNADRNAQLDHDFVCKIDDSEGFGRSHIEVKTRWRGCHRAAPSLSDPDDNYMLLVEGYFQNLFATAKPEPLVSETC